MKKIFLLRVTGKKKFVQKKLKQEARREKKDPVKIFTMPPLQMINGRPLITNSSNIGMEIVAQVQLLQTIMVLIEERAPRVIRLFQSQYNGMFI